MTLVLKLAVRFVVFGIALAYACRKDANIVVQPRSALPAVALVFALLNTLLYGVLVPILNVATLWMFWLLVPFVANALLLLLTDKLLRFFRIDGLGALAKAAAIVTIAHVLLRVVHL